MKITFKAVLKGNKSVFANGELQTTYKIGTVVRGKHEQLPMYVVHPDNFNEPMDTLLVCADFDKVLVVGYNEEDVSNFLPWQGKVELADCTVESIAKDFVRNFHSEHLGLNKLRVLGVAKLKDFNGNLKVAHAHYSKKFANKTVDKQ